MDINRHNYESFFLLYVDNELSAADRKLVELFVQENADLKTELQLLQQTVFNADEIIFDNKQALLKDENFSLQESLLLYLDSELNDADTAKTFDLLKTDATAQKEFALLQRTQLQADTSIIFANKQSLYRKEEGRVIRLPWLKIAAAAVLLGFGTWATVAVVNNGNKVNNGGEVAGTTPEKNTSTPIIANTTPVSNGSTAAKDNNSGINASNTATSTTGPNTAAGISKQKNDQPGVITNVRQNLPQEKENTTIAVKEINQRGSNNLPKPDYNNFNNNERNKTDIAYVPQTDKAIDKAISGNAATTASFNNTNAGDGYALNTQFTQGNADEQNNDKVLYMDEDNVKKSKLGGFFRKVKRLVERNTNIKTGNGIKVAGFDIAIK